MNKHKSNIRSPFNTKSRTNGFRVLSIILPVLFLSFAFSFLFYGGKREAISFAATREIETKQAALMPKLEGSKAKDYLKEHGLSDSLGEAITKARYKVRPVEQKTLEKENAQFESGNPRNGYHAIFKADGTAELIGGAKTNRWESSFKLLKYGRGENFKDVTSSSWRAAESRAENRRDSIIEWFENKPSGLEHGFTITEKPEAAAEMRALRVTMKIGGNLRPQLDENGQALALGNQVLRYSKLKVLDAGGAELPARMSLQGEELTIEANDANAVYPVTIDPVFEPLKKLTASDGAAGDQFGWSVSISGDTAIVGAYGDDNSKGAAYIFERNQGGANNWGEVKKLTPSVAAFDSFGWSVSISGDTAVVGALAVFEGKVYVFERNTGGANNWGEAKIINDPDQGTADHFGLSVSISGDTVIVGTWSFGGQYGNWVEEVYIFERNKDGANNWGLVKTLTASDSSILVFEYFGYSVSISGDTAIVGSYADNNGKGAAYIFERNAGGADNWGEVKKITASDGAAGDNFGVSVSISGDVAVIGAFGDDNGKGAAYIFERNNGGMNNWGEVKKLTASDGAANNAFGGSVSISVDTAIVAGLSSAYIFERNTGGADNWGQVKKLTASDGGSVSISGDTAIVGASGDDGGKGSAYVFGAVVSQPNQFKWFYYSDLLLRENVLNQVTAGSNAPIRFSLGGYKGDPYSQPPTSVQISCSTLAPIGAEQVIDRFAPDPYYSGLYDFYQTTWRTKTTWKYTCRRLTLYFTDGTTQSLNFYFK